MKPWSPGLGMGSPSASLVVGLTLLARVDRALISYARVWNSERDHGLRTVASDRRGARRRLGHGAPGGGAGGSPSCLPRSRWRSVGARKIRRRGPYGILAAARSWRRPSWHLVRLFAASRRSSRAGARPPVRTRGSPRDRGRAGDRPAPRDRASDPSFRTPCITLRARPTARVAGAARPHGGRGRAPCRAGARRRRRLTDLGPRPPRAKLRVRSSARAGVSSAPARLIEEPPRTERARITRRVAPSLQRLGESLQRERMRAVRRLRASDS